MKDSNLRGSDTRKDDRGGTSHSAKEGGVDGAKIGELRHCGLIDAVYS